MVRAIQSPSFHHRLQRKLRSSFSSSKQTNRIDSSRRTNVETVLHVAMILVFMVLIANITFNNYSNTSSHYASFRGVETRTKAIPSSAKIIQANDDGIDNTISDNNIASLVDDDAYEEDDYYNYNHKISFHRISIETLIIQTFQQSPTLSPLYDTSNPSTFSLYNTSTPQGKAFQWLLEDDLKLVPISSSSFSSATTTITIQEYYQQLLRNILQKQDCEIVQRYILAVLFFSTGGFYETSSSLSYNNNNNHDENKEIILSWSLLHDEDFLHFLSPKLHECDWNNNFIPLVLHTPHHDKPTNVDTTDSRENTIKIFGGVKSCTNTKNNSILSSYSTSTSSLPREITSLLLPDLGLIGTIPDELGFLSQLQVLDFTNNLLSGSIPNSFGLLTNLQRLSLGHNNLTGTIPKSMRQLKQLQTLFINFNDMHTEIQNLNAETSSNDTNETSTNSMSEICELSKHGLLYNIWADCSRIVHPFECSCCTVCCDSLDSCGPNNSNNDRYSYTGEDDNDELDDV